LKLDRRPSCLLRYDMSWYDYTLYMPYTSMSATKKMPLKELQIINHSSHLVDNLIAWKALIWVEGEVL
jgi:hypothetical protein